MLSGQGRTRTFDVSLVPNLQSGAVAAVPPTHYQTSVYTIIRCLLVFYWVTPVGDFIIDINGKLLKIQVKTCRIFEEEGYIDFATSTSHTNTQGTVNHSYSEKEIDYFATIYNNECYLIPFEKCGKRAQRIRYVPTKNGQTKGVIMAKDYLLKDVIEKL